MIRTVLFMVYFWLILLLSLVIYPVYLILSLFDKNCSSRFIHSFVSAWARNMLWAMGARVELTGLENLPAENNICFVSNHQSYADIILILGYIPKAVGFIAKVELFRVPLLSFWMKKLNCIFIDRKSLRQSAEAIGQGIRNIKSGVPMVIFPEGTRSKSEKIGQFLAGSLKLATRSNAIVVPLTIENTYRVFEENGKITPAQIGMIIHPPIRTDLLSLSEKNQLSEKIWHLIQSEV